MFTWNKTLSPALWLLPLLALSCTPAMAAHDPGTGPHPGADRQRGLHAGILLPDGRRLGRTGREDPQGD
jgi:hypothetical protein